MVAPRFVVFALVAAIVGFTASEASAERAFFRLRLTVTDQRTSLKPRTVSACIRLLFFGKRRENELLAGADGAAVQYPLVEISDDDDDDDDDDEDDDEEQEDEEGEDEEGENDEDEDEESDDEQEQAERVHRAELARVRADLAATEAQDSAERVCSATKALFKCMQERLKRTPLLVAPAWNTVQNKKCVQCREACKNHARTQVFWCPTCDPTTSCEAVACADVAVTRDEHGNDLKQLVIMKRCSTCETEARSMWW